MFVQSNPHIKGDAPSVYRSHGYKLARIWQQYLKTGICADYERDKDSYVFATDLFIITGIPLIDNLEESNVIKVFGFNPFDSDAALALKAPLASPALTGTPTAPTASVGTSTTQVATTAYVVAEINKIEEW